MIASTYAVALKELFYETNKTKKDFGRFLEDFQQVETALKKHQLFFVSPLVSLEEKKQVLEKALGKGLILSFLSLLLDKKRWLKLSSILDYLQKLEEKAILKVTVEALEPLEQDVKEKLKTVMGHFFNKQIILEIVSGSAENIGGLKLKAGEFVFDDTLLFHIQQMENQIRRKLYDYTSQ